MDFKTTLPVSTKASVTTEAVPSLAVLKGATVKTLAVTTKYPAAAVAVTASVTLSNAGFNIIKFFGALSTGTIEI
jgi:hypothetical protein